MNKSQLLIITSNSLLPVKDGADLRIYNLITNLPKIWDIDLICVKPETEQSQKEILAAFRNVYFAEYFEGDQPRILKYSDKVKNLISPSKNLFPFDVAYSTHLYNLIQQAISIKSYEAILCFWTSTFGFYLSNLQDLNITCDVCDSTSLYARSMRKTKKLFGKEWLSLYYAFLYNLRWENKYLTNCKKLITITERDKKWLSKTVPESKIRVVGNGVDLTYFTPDVALPGTTQGLVVFTGVMGYKPNHDAMIYCLREIWPLIKKKAPEAKFRIVGRHPKSELIELAKSQKDAEVIGEVEDIRQAIKGANVYLCPIRIGAGMKNKILEALAMGIPVVTTSEGAGGIEFEHGKVGYIANSRESLAFYTAKLLDKNDEWERLSRAARKLVVEKYNWKSQAEKLSNILLE